MDESFKCPTGKTLMGYGNCCPEENGTLSTTHYDYEDWTKPFLTCLFLKPHYFLVKFLIELYFFHSWSSSSRLFVVCFLCQRTVKCYNCIRRSTVLLIWRFPLMWFWLWVGVGHEGCGFKFPTQTYSLWSFNNIPREKKDNLQPKEREVEGGSWFQGIQTVFS